MIPEHLREQEKERLYRAGMASKHGAQIVGIFGAIGGAALICLTGGTALAPACVLAVAGPWAGSLAGAYAYYRG